MIYWLNGAYGVGKTTVANCLKERLRNAHIFDPELVGNGLRDNYPKSLFFETFEQYPRFMYYSAATDSLIADPGISAPMTFIQKFVEFFKEFFALIFSIFKK